MTRLLHIDIIIELFVQGDYTVAIAPKYMYPLLLAEPSLASQYSFSSVNSLGGG